MDQITVLVEHWKGKTRVTLNVDTVKGVESQVASALGVKYVLDRSNADEITHMLLLGKSSWNISPPKTKRGLP